MSGKRPSAGYTLIEMAMVLVIVAVGLGVATLYLTSFLGQTSARRAAQVFSRDLAQARAFATRSREGVTVRFFEDSMVYRVQSEGGRLLVRRSFQAGDDIPLSALDLELVGDSVRFDARGLAAIAGLGTAAFAAGADVYEVRFNGTGASRVAPR